MTRKEKWGGFGSGPVSELVSSVKGIGILADASNWIKQHCFSPLAIFLFGSVGWFLGFFFQLFPVLVFIYTNEIKSYLMDLI